jgi:2-polyprenyl-6-methoxyphenol hydroxylase-like FAD-dependent oxidoreductase
MKIHRVVVIGAGVAGLACALSCARSGVRVEVLEARNGVTHVPAHIDLVPNLLRDLALLGVADACVRRGFAYNGVALVDEHGDEALRLPTPRLAGAQLPPAAGIAHDDLLSLLAGAAVQSGVTMHADCAVRAVGLDDGRVVADGGRVFEADLVVLAVGAESPLVDVLFGPAPPAAIRHVWWHALAPRPPWLERSTWMAGSVGRRLLFVPIGMSRAGVAVVNAVAPDEPADAGALIRLLESWGALPRRIAAAIEPSTPIARRVVGGSLREAPWYRDAALCVGAAAHAVAPPFGQSAAQALEDAVVLGELLAAGLERQVLLQGFMARRGARVQRLHALTEQAARWIARPEPSTDLAQLADEIGALVAQPA